MASSIANIAKIPELRRRILLTLVLLAVYRVGVFVSVPGVNRQVMKDMVKAASGSFLGLFNMFSGGALEQMSIFALRIKRRKITSRFKALQISEVLQTHLPLREHQQLILEIHKLL